MGFELGLKETTGPTGGTQKGECWVAPLMARQPPVVVVVVVSMRLRRRHRVWSPLQCHCPYYLGRTRREMRQAKPPARDGAVRAPLGL